jgi:hypothetical protein
MIRVQGNHPQVATVKGVPSVPAPLWEWTVDRGIASTSTGVCGALPRAVEALSRSLVKAGGPSSGRVVPVALVDSALGFSYVRLHPTLTAECVKGVITWK